MALDYSLEELLLEREDGEDSKLIDLSVFEEWEECLRNDTKYDIVGVLALVPTMKQVDDYVKMTITLFQTQNESIEIEFNTTEADDKNGQVPKLQRLAHCPGTILFIRHIKPTRKGEAGLCKPFDRARKIFDHRTILAIDASDDELDKMRTGQLVHFGVNEAASVIPPPARGKKRGQHFPLHKDERVAIKALIPLVQRFRYHYSRIEQIIEPSEVNESKMAQYIRTVHSKLERAKDPIDQLDSLVNKLKLDGTKEETENEDPEQENKANAIKLREMLLEEHVSFELLTFIMTKPDDFVKYLKLPSE